MGKKVKRKKKEKLLDEYDVFGEFAFIAGYTEGGVPFGVLHEESEDEEENTYDRRDELLPF